MKHYVLILALGIVSCYSNESRQTLTRLPDELKNDDLENLRYWTISQRSRHGYIVTRHGENDSFFNLVVVKEDQQFKVKLADSFLHLKDSAYFNKKVRTSIEQLFANVQLFIRYDLDEILWIEDAEAIYFQQDRRTLAFTKDAKKLLEYRPQLNLMKFGSDWYYIE